MSQLDRRRRRRSSGKGGDLRGHSPTRLRAIHPWAESVQAPKLGYMAGDLDAGRQAFEKRAWRSATCLLAESHGAATPGEVWR